jgi:hypothetical protein
VHCASSKSQILRGKSGNPKKRKTYNINQHNIIDRKKTIKLNLTHFHCNYSRERERCRRTSTTNEQRYATV